MSDNTSLNEGLKDFLLEESSNLDRIEYELNSFNPFNVLNIEEHELRHSNFLAWLLNPIGSHTTNDYFLKRFILQLVNLQTNQKIALQLKDLSETIIYRERDNIDILIVNHEEKFVVCIENKVNAGRTGINQLIKYANLVNSEWKEKEYKTYFVYLTKFPQRLTDEELETGYENITYDTVINILANLLHDIPTLDLKIRDFISFYVENYKRNFMSDGNELSQLATEIYKKHKVAIDYIISKKPVIHGSKNIEYVRQQIKDSEKYSLLTPNEKGIIIRFLPKEIKQIFTNKEFNSWNDNDVFFAIELFLFEESLDVKFCFGAVNCDETKFDELQKIKEDAYNKMLEFDSLKGKINSRTINSKSKSTNKYPGIYYKSLLKIDSKEFSNASSFEEAFKEVFKNFEDEILNKWTDEVKQKLQPNN